MFNVAILLFLFFSLVLAVLIFRKLKKAPHFIKQKWEATAAYVPPQRPTPPPLEVSGTPHNQKARRDDDFENAMMGLNPADQVGNPFWGIGGSRDRDDD